MTFWLQNATDLERCLFANQQGRIENGSFHSNYISGATFEVIDRFGTIYVFSDNIFEIWTMTESSKLPYFRHVFTKVQETCEILGLDVIWRVRRRSTDVEYTSVNSLHGIDMFQKCHIVDFFCRTVWIFALWNTKQSLGILSLPFPCRHLSCCWESLDTVIVFHIPYTAVIFY